MGSKRYAVLTTLEWSDRKEDGSLETTRVNAGETTDAIPAESIEPLLEGKAIEPYDRTKHRDGWWARRQAELLDAANKNSVPRTTATIEEGPAGSRTIATGEGGLGEDNR